MEQRFNLTLIILGAIIFTGLIAGLLWFTVSNKSGEIDEISGLSADILSNIKIDSPAQYGPAPARYGFQ